MSRYDLAGRTVLITGSTRGLGSAIPDAIAQAKNAGWFSRP